VRARFPHVCAETGWKDKQNNCDGKILCVHHCFEGATVGPGDYTFRYNDDVIRIRDVPEEFLAVLSGHIHRFQVLTKDLKSKSIATPILYPGSIERTSFAEKDEPKGYLKVELRKNETMNKEGMNQRGKTKTGQLALSWKFIKLPARPMVRVNIPANGLCRNALKDFILQALKELDPESVVKLHVEGQVKEEALSVLRAESLRALAPSQMNVSLRFPTPKESLY
jgi:DNA repair exonuclease SbcCD nuclease subunit